MIVFLILFITTSAFASDCIEPHCWDGTVDRSVLISKNNDKKPISEIVDSKNDVKLYQRLCDDEKCDPIKPIPN